jgi:hypothetical protein
MDRAVNVDWPTDLGVSSALHQEIMTIANHPIERRAAQWNRNRNKYDKVHDCRPDQDALAVSHGVVNLTDAWSA